MTLIYFEIVSSRTEHVGGQMVASAEEQAQLEQKKRENLGEIDTKETQIRELRVGQRLRFIWLAASLVAAVLLGWAMLVGAWRDEKGVFSVVETIAAVLSTAIAAWQILAVRPTVARGQYDLQQLENEQLSLAATAAVDPAITLRIYWVSARKDVELYRSKARRSRRTSNINQWTIIIGSATATSLTAVSAGGASSNVGFKIGAAALSLVVTVAASAGGFFKFRDRSFNQQQAADSIEKEIKASELRIGDYGQFASEDKEVEALQLFAQRIEAVKDEQRKRELQLEQSTESKDGRAA